jgi:hypothetical protein
MEKDRLEAFSDGVIAIIITIMVLELKAPHGDSSRRSLPLLPTFLSYVLSFVYVGIYWNNHHHMLRASARISGAVLWANLCSCSGSRSFRSRPRGWARTISARFHRRSTASSFSWRPSRICFCNTRSSPPRASRRCSHGGGERLERAHAAAALRDRHCGGVLVALDRPGGLHRRRADVAGARRRIERALAQARRSPS